MSKKRIGIYSGTFDPVHKGHIDFALQAIQKAGLDEVIFLPETLPRHKPHVTHISHRLSMLNNAIKPYPKLKSELLPDKRFTVATSLPRINALYPNATILMLIGSDVLSHMSVWPLIKELLSSVGLVVAVRGGRDERHTLNLVSKLPVEPNEFHVLASSHKFIESKIIRAELKKGNIPDGSLASVVRYSKKNWIYESVLGESSS